MKPDKEVEILGCSYEKTEFELYCSICGMPLTEPQHGRA